MTNKKIQNLGIERQALGQMRGINSARKLLEFGMENRVLDTAIGRPTALAIVRSFQEQTPDWIKQAKTFKPSANAIYGLNSSVRVCKGYEFPDMGLISQTLRELRTNSLYGNTSELHLEAARLTQSIGGMNQPWANTINAKRSVLAFKKLHDFSSAFNDIKGFENKMLTSLRVSLGDWRQTIFPDAISGSPFKRDEFYIAQGFDSSLSDFPDEAFDEVMQCTGLSSSAPTVSKDNQVDETKSHLSNIQDGQSIINELEYQIRLFINKKMTDQYGSNWPKNKLPPKTLANWRNKRDRSIKAGFIKGSLITYADFNDYCPLIRRSDVWRDVFELYFKRPENVQEAFNRMRPSRVEVMHGRPLTKTDRLYLKMEVRRMLDTIAGVLKAN